MKNLKIIFFVILLSFFYSCKKFLDVVPDNIATIENAFTQRSSAEKYLFTCFSYLPRHGDFNSNPAFTAGDEVWYMYPARDVSTNFWNIARGEQSSNDPLGDFWTGDKGGTKLFQGLRDCNIFLENIWKVKDMDQGEKDRWIDEVKFLKAYYHFYLLQLYGPIPLIKQNLPIGSTSEEVQVYRDPVDSCFNYIVSLLNEVAANEILPPRIIGSEATELGRITQAIVLSFKAKVLVTAASPLFNGNTNMASLKDDQGRQLFNQVNDPNKWVIAAAACKSAIEYCTNNGYALYHFPPGNGIGWVIAPPIQTQLDIRTATTEKLFNTEIIWSNTASRAKDVQRWAMPLIAAGTSGSGPKGIIAPPIKMAELFYTKNGVPINEDITWDYAGRYNLKTATAADKYYIKQSEQTVKLHFDREPRFYADLAFDRGVWFGNWIGNFSSDNLFFVKARKGETAARQGVSNFSATGYWVKKLVGMGTTAASDGNVTGSNMTEYPWPEMRVADLYLLYAEALNEVSGPGSETYNWINQVRARAGLNTVESSWANFSSDNSKYTTKTGLRDIIQQERLIELAFEGQRFWDLRRWKKAHTVMSAPVKGWDTEQADAASYYKEVILFNQNFRIRDYFWPIEINELLRNKKLVQNTGW
ncbi:MAG TPA: RagB/SusD family nutrient uptake outer membrane protein [Chitinophagaceae bacterium]